MKLVYYTIILVGCSLVFVPSCKEKNHDGVDINRAKENQSESLQNARRAALKKIKIDESNLKGLIFYDSISYSSKRKGNPKYIIKFLIRKSVVLIAYYDLAKGFEDGYYVIREVDSIEKDVDGNPTGYGYGLQEEVNAGIFGEVLIDPMRLENVGSFKTFKKRGVVLGLKDLPKV
ncbi:MAG: hypothetical protein H7A51_16150 [Akkermansiaceae bacterium]|nr:hypothetical protein [Akkermansiaceae bacterium]